MVRPARARSRPEEHPHPMKPINRTQELAADQQMIDGLVKHQSDIPSLVLGTATMQNAAMVQRLQQRIANAKAAVTARVIWLAAVAADKAQREADRQWLDDLKQRCPAARGRGGMAGAQPARRPPRQRD